MMKEITYYVGADDVRKNINRIKAMYESGELNSKAGDFYDIKVSIKRNRSIVIRDGRVTFYGFDDMDGEEARRYLERKEGNEREIRKLTFNNGIKKYI